MNELIQDMRQIIRDYETLKIKYSSIEKYNNFLLQQNEDLKKQLTQQHNIEQIQSRVELDLLITENKRLLELVATTQTQDQLLQINQSDQCKFDDNCYNIIKEPVQVFQSIDKQQLEAYVKNQLQLLEKTKQTSNQSNMETSTSAITHQLASTQLPQQMEQSALLPANLQQMRQTDEFYNNNEEEDEDDNAYKNIPNYQEFDQVDLSSD